MDEIAQRALRDEMKAAVGSEATMLAWAATGPGLAVLTAFSGSAPPINQRVAAFQALFQTAANEEVVAAWKAARASDLSARQAATAPLLAPAIATAATIDSTIATLAGQLETYRTQVAAIVAQRVVTSDAGSRALDPHAAAQAVLGLKFQAAAALFLRT